METRVRSPWLGLLAFVPLAGLGLLAAWNSGSSGTAEETRVRLEIEALDADLAREVGRIAVELGLEMEGVLTVRASRLAEAAPTAGMAAAMHTARAAVARLGADPQGHGAWSGDLRLLDGAGRALDPAAFVPSDGDAAGAVSTEALFADLALQADRLHYGDGDLAGAQEIWRDARERFTSAVLQARCEIELARLTARASDTPAALLQAELEAIETRFDLATMTSVGRPAVLAWVLAGRTDRLLGALRSGLLDRTPLTGAERIVLTDLLASGIAQVGTSDPVRSRILPRASKVLPEPVVWGTGVAGGARLELHVEPAVLWRCLEERMAARPVHKHARVTLTAVVAEAGRGPGRAATAWSLAARKQVVLGPRGTPGVMTVATGHWQRFEDGRAERSRFLLLVIASLVLLSGLGFVALRRARVRERAVQRLRDDFIANVTHEVRTPLTSVLLHAEMLADEQLSADARETSARVVHTEGARLATLVEDMLDFTALERGTRTFEAVPLDLGSAAARAVEPYRLRAERAGVELTLDVAGGEVVASADPGAVSRILANLMGNAWKHGRPSRDGSPGRIQLRVYTETGVPHFEIRDDGPGIPKAEHAQVFERFGRARGAAATEGAGLGLALSRDLAHAMGGTLWVDPADGGTVFRLSLPALPETMDA